MNQSCDQPGDQSAEQPEIVWPEPARLSAEAAIAGALLGHPPDTVVSLLGRGPNRLFRVCAAGGNFLLKLYGGPDFMRGDRMARECNALNYLQTGPLADRVPRLVATDAQAVAAVFEWVEGEVVVGRGRGDMAQLLGVLNTLPAVSCGAEAAAFPAASGAASRPADLARQIETYRDGLQRHATDAQKRWVLGRFDAFWPKVRATLLAPQDPARLLLSPVGLGFHNALRRADGRLVFLNFGRFGWDDPVRLVADMLWNPVMPLSAEEAEIVRGATFALFGERDGGFARRFARAWPAMGLRWALLLLDDLWTERAKPADAARRDAQRQRQISRAEAVIGRVEASLHAAA